uniref:Uncharacterized protein n=1 Tax=viral metagenome TaxID=1070528 RepID=A0A6M3JMD4_9ZZZZ
MTDISREAVEELTSLIDITHALITRYEKLVAAAKQVIDEIEPHGHWHCVDALKDALEE